MKAAAESNIKKISLELGGKSPTVVLADADIVQAAKWSALGIMYGTIYCHDHGSELILALLVASIG